MVIWHAFNSLPHWHRKMVLILSIMVMMLAAWPSEQAVATRVDDNGNELAIEQQVDEEALLAEAKPVAPPKPSYITKQVKVRSGDNMGVIFQRLGLSTTDLHLIDQLEGTDTLRLLKPGQELTFKLTKGGELHSLYYPHSLEQALKVSRKADSFVARPVKLELDTREQVAKGEIRSSFWGAAVDAGMTEDQIMDLAAIFGWDIDFAQDLQPGDSFRVVYEEKYQDDERVASGDILAAEFINQGATYRAVLNEDGNYYTPDGKAMRKSFLRAPVNFKYISSNFNPRRLHPVTGKVRPHTASTTCAGGDPHHGGGRRQRGGRRLQPVQRQLRLHQARWQLRDQVPAPLQAHRQQGAASQAGPDHRPARRHRPSHRPTPAL